MNDSGCWLLQAAFIQVKYSDQVPVYFDYLIRLVLAEYLVHPFPVEPVLALAIGCGSGIFRQHSQQRIRTRLERFHRLGEDYHLVSGGKKFLK